MRFRKLRIGWSIVWGIVAVLLVVLWVRSYLRFDQFIHSNPPADYFAISSGHGLVMFGRSDDPVLGQFFAAGWARKGFAWSEWYDKNGGPACFPASIYAHHVIPWLEYDSPHYVHAAGLTSSQVKVPYWLLILLLAALATSPWVTWRFSLRTLLIATTLVAIALGLIVALV
jgi:hypothetical protein